MKKYEMGHEYNEIIDILSESINLTESIPMAREGLIEEFEPIFADEYSIYNPSLDPYQMISNQLVNQDLLPIDLAEHPPRYHYRRSSRRSNSLPQRNIIFCSYPRPNSFMPVNFSNNSTQTQSTSNNDQIELSSDSGDENEVVHRRVNRDRWRSKRQTCINTRQTSQVPTSEPVESHSEETAQSSGNTVNETITSDSNSNVLQYVDHETSEIVCDCSQCFPESRDSQHKRKHLERTCKQNKKQCRTTASSSQMPPIEPLPGPSGITSSISNVNHQTMDSSDSEEEVQATIKVSHQRQQSDVLSAPELQLDCFSDSSSDSSNDVIAIETPNTSSTSISYNRNTNTEGSNFRPIHNHNRNRGYENMIDPPNPPLRPLMSMNTVDIQNDGGRCPYNQSNQYSQNYRNSYFTNNRYYPDARAPNAPDFGRNSVFNASNTNYNNSSGSNSGQGRTFGRWLNRGEHHYRRRFYNNAPRPSLYIPHQRLWHQQQFVQEMYRRFMTNNYEDHGRYYNNHSFNSNNNPQSFSPHYWHRRGYPVHPTPHTGSYPMRLFPSGLQDDDFSAMYVPPMRRYANRGASQETIENNTLSYKFLPINENFDSEKCSICLSPFEVDTFVRRLPCMHFYHRECIEQWLQLNSTCPICRIDIQKSRNLL